jgi:hypothetical protein
MGGFFEFSRRVGGFVEGAFAFGMRMSVVHCIAYPGLNAFLRLPRSPHSLAQASEEKELACAYAALVLHDAGKPISAVSC